MRAASQRLTPLHPHTLVSRQTRGCQCAPVTHLPRLQQVGVRDRVLCTHPLNALALVLQPQLIDAPVALAALAPCTAAAAVAAFLAAPAAAVAAVVRAAACSPGAGIAGVAWGPRRQLVAHLAALVQHAFPHGRCKAGTAAAALAALVLNVAAAAATEHSLGAVERCGGGLLLAARALDTVRGHIDTLLVRCLVLLSQPLVVKHIVC
eukprot:365632-Chlamydomonas_euryale.AAC.15